MCFLEQVKKVSFVVSLFSVEKSILTYTVDFFLIRKISTSIARTNMKTTKKQNSLFSKRRGVSPILATVILLGISVVGGGLAFAVFSSGMTTASQNNVIAIENAQAVKGTGHADITATVKNAGGKPWAAVEMTVSKTELSEPILYESLHENVVGCAEVEGADETDELAEMNANGICLGTGNGGDEGAADGNRDNPMRAQWLISLDKSSTGDNNDREDDVADKGEGAAVGRKLVFQSKDDLRTIQVLNGTAVAPLFGMEDQNGSTTPSGNTEETCSPNSDTYVDCTAVFQELDSSTDGYIFCNKPDDTVQCKVFTHTNIKDDPISSGESVYFYADAFTKEIPGLHNQVVRVGDNIVVNIASEDVDGGTARVQTIIKVIGS